MDSVTGSSTVALGSTNIDNEEEVASKTPCKRSFSVMETDSNNDNDRNNNEKPGNVDLDNDKTTNSSTHNIVDVTMEDLVLEESKLFEKWDSAQEEQELEQTKSSMMQLSTKLVDDMVRSGLTVFYKLEALECENRKLQQKIDSKDAEIERLRTSEEESRATITVSTALCIADHLRHLRHRIEFLTHSPTSLPFVESTQGRRS
jgi:predicted RNase H-like nuclease (RuvC/YqgF family)